MTPPNSPAVSESKRLDTIVTVLDQAFSELMAAAPDAFRTKYRKMAADPFAFYRGTACLFYSDVTSGAKRDTGEDWVDEQSGHIWIHGDLHVENFGTYLDDDGRLVFDVNDFDEAYIGRFTWDLQRFAASLALVGWQKALPEDDVRSLIATYLRAYLDQVLSYRGDTGDDYALYLHNTDGPIHEVLAAARKNRRVDFLDGATTIQDGHRVLIHDATVRALDVGEQTRVVEAFERYRATIPEDKRHNDLFYEVRDVAGKAGFGIGSAGLPAYNVLVEGHSQALDNDVLLSMKQANVPAVSRFVDHETVEQYFENDGHRCVVSQWALQAHTDPLLGWTDIDGVGYMVSEVSPYEVDLSWDNLTEPSDIAAVVRLLGRATAKVHCASDADSDQELVTFQVEDAIAESIGDRHDEFVNWVCDFALRYSAQVRDDHALFVEAFRTGRIGVSSTA